MGVAHVGLVHRDPCECKVKGLSAVSSIERNVSKRRHLQGVRQNVATVGADVNVPGTGRAEPNISHPFWPPLPHFLSALIVCCFAIALSE